MKITLHLQQRQRSSRSPLLSKRRERNLKGSPLMFQRWNATIATSLGHFARDCRQTKKKSKRRFQAFVAEEEEEEEEEPKKKKKTKANKEEPRREYYLISALTCSFTDCATSWLVDSGASRNMTGNCGALTSYRKKKFTTQVELGDDSTYKIEGVGSTSLQLDSGTVLHIDDVLYVPSLKKNLLSVAGLEDKGYRVLFMDKKVLLWAKDEELSSAIQIGV